MASVASRPASPRASSVSEGWTAPHWFDLLRDPAAPHSNRALTLSQLSKPEYMGQLLQLCRADSPISHDEDALLAAVGAVAVLARASARHTMLEAGAVPVLTQLLRSPLLRVRKEAVMAMHRLVIAGDPSALAKKLSVDDSSSSSGPGGFDQLIALLVQLVESSDNEESASATRTIVHFLSRGPTAHDARSAVVRADGPALLAREARSSDYLRVERAFSILDLLAKHPPLRPLIARTGIVLSFLEPVLLNSRLLMRRGVEDLMISQLREDPSLDAVFDHLTVRVRRLLLRSSATTDPAFMAHRFYVRGLLTLWFPPLAEEIDRFDSFEAWQANARHLDQRLWLLSWRRGYVAHH
jgi:hypothetical protein